MGVDLYYNSTEDAIYNTIRPLYDAAVELFEGIDDSDEELLDLALRIVKCIGKAMWEYSRRVEFRDSYGSSILARFGLSWWTDVLPMLTEYPEMQAHGPGLLQPDACHRVADMLERAEPVAGQTAEEERIADQYRGQLVEFLRRGAVAGGIDADL